MTQDPKDKAMFEQLAASDTGKQFLSYLTRLVASVCDSRTWAEGEDKTHANKVARVLEEEIINKISLRNPALPDTPYPYQ